MRKLFICALYGLLVLAGCKKEIKQTSLQEELPAPAGGGGGGGTVIDKLKSLAQAFLYDARVSSTFKRKMYNECFKQKYDDYYIPVRDLIAINDTLQLWSSTRKTYILGLVNDIIAFGQNQPVVFIPFLEDKTQTWITNNQFPVGIPDAVLKDEYNSSTLTCPAYTLNQSDNLVSKNFNVDEDYAWANDVWVFGAEEGVPTNDTTIGHSYSPSEFNVASRFDGQTENGAIIKVTDIGSIESWVNGKPEFLYKVHTASGSVIINNLELPKVHRRNVKNTWKDFGVFIAFWNVANIGNWMIEGWAEQDCRGGTCNATTYTQNFPAPCTGCPTTSISYQLKNVDVDMGLRMIQFSDPITTEYQISYAVIKRKN